MITLHAKIHYIVGRGIVVKSNPINLTSTKPFTRLPLHANLVSVRDKDKEVNSHSTNLKTPTK